MNALGTFFVLFSISLLFGQALSHSYSMYGDISIQTLNNGSLYCDSYMCPQATAFCKVTKKNDPNNFQVILRNRRCFDGQGTILAEQTVNEENKYNSRVNTEVTSGSNRQMTPEEKRELQEYLRATNERVQAEIAEAMAPFRDGTFAANLQREIQQSIRNSFN